MLIELAVTNLGVVSQLHLVFDDAMTAVTGETGAGKTMIVGALGLLCGFRAEPTMVRNGEVEASVEGRFVRGDDEWVVRRVIPASGRSRSYINGAMVSVAELTSLTSTLVDLHAQHAQQALLGVAGQRAALDRFANVDLGPLNAARHALNALKCELEELGGDPALREREAELLRYQIEELGAAELDDPNEDEKLTDMQRLLNNVVDDRMRVNRVIERLASDGAVLEVMGESIRDLRDNESFASHRQRLEGLRVELDDVLSELRRTEETLVEDPERLARIVERRQLLVDLRRRYQCDDLHDLIEKHQDLQSRLAALNSAADRVRELVNEIEAAQDHVREAAAIIGDRRRAEAPVFAKKVEAELRKLAMPNAHLEFDVSSDDPGDDVSVKFSANPGLSPAPLARVASGGELARVMLALRLVSVSDQETLVFDEVDAGIGGEAAVAVGEALARVAQRRQVLVVTHLAQVAASASTQIGVTKVVADTRTQMNATVLDGEARVVELSRMMSGNPTSDAANEHARELLIGGSGRGSRA